MAMLSQLFRRRVVDDDQGLSPNTRSTRTFRPHNVALTILWFGMITGFMELGLFTVRWSILGRITYETLRSNWHVGWMIPVSNLLIFGVVGGVLGLIGVLVPKAAASRLGIFAGVFLAALAMTQFLPGVHKSARLALAMGFACLSGSWLQKHERLLTPLVRRTLPLGAIFLSILVMCNYCNVAWDEHRVLAGLAKAAPGTPNVLLIVLDTVRADALSPYGYERDTTPNLARLAERGVRFEHARSTAPWTLPSHASLFTGRWRHETSANVGIALDDSHPTIAEFLSRRGYATAGFAANTENCNAWYGLNRGFAHYEDYYENTEVSPVELLRSSCLGRVRALIQDWAPPSRANDDYASLPLSQVSRDDQS